MEGIRKINILIFSFLNLPTKTFNDSFQKDISNL